MMGRTGQTLLPPVHLTRWPAKAICTWSAPCPQVLCIPVLIPPSHCQCLAPSSSSWVLCAKSTLPVNLYFPTSAVITDASCLLGVEVDVPSLKFLEKGYKTRCYQVCMVWALLKGRRCLRHLLQIPRFYGLMSGLGKPEGKSP